MADAQMHLDRDPNDPRNVPNADALGSLNEDPELPVVLPEVVDVEDGNAVVHLGVDPNDVRLKVN